MRSLVKMKVFLCLALCLCMAMPMAPLASAASVPYLEGRLFGAQYAESIAQNIHALYSAAMVSRQEITTHASACAELYSGLLPEKLSWIDGVAAGSNLAIEDLYALNFSDKLVGGLVGECSTFMAHGTALQDGGTVIAKNRDQSIQVLSEVAVQEAARYPEGELYQAAYIEIPQVAETYRFVGSRTAGRWGYGMGVNEWGVTVSDNDANSRDELQFETGLHDNDVIRLVLERAKTAREGVDVVTALVEEYGQAWNGIMFEIADTNELWIVEVTGKRWAAKQYVDTVTARSNQFQIEDDYDLCSEDLLSFAKETWGVEPDANGKINFRAAYGTLELYPESNENIKDRPSAETLYNTEMRYRRAMELLNQCTADGGKIQVADFAQMVRDHFDSYTLPSGKVVEMNQVPFYSSELVDWYGREWYDIAPEKDTIETSIYIRGVCGHDLGWGATSATGILVAQENKAPLMLHSMMPPCMSAFVPFYPMQTAVEPRFNTSDAALLFNTIATKSFGFYTLFHAPVRSALDPYEKAMFEELDGMNAAYTALVKAGCADQAALLLTGFSDAQAKAAYSAAELAVEYMRIAAVEDSGW